MIETLFAKLGAIIIAPILAITSFFAPNPEPPAVGTALPEAVAVFETSLAAPITANATTMTLTANSIRGGGTLSGFNCFTIDEGSSQAEFVCGTVATTTVTGLTRGISPADGITEDTDLQFSHRRGANVKITDFPIIQRLKLQNNGEGTYENVLSYAAGVTPTGNNDITDVEYVLGVVNGGTVSFDQEIVTGNAGETVATGTVVYRSLADGEWYKADSDVAGSFTDRLIGITQGAGTNGNSITNGILISGVDSNQSGLSANSLYFLSSTAGGVQTATSSQIIGVAKSTTELILAPHILDTYNGYSATYAGNNTFTGSSTFSGTTTLSNFVDITASTFNYPKNQRVFTSSSTFSVPANIDKLWVEVIGAGAGGQSPTNDTGAGGGGGAYCAGFIDVSATSSLSITIGTGGAEGANGGTTSVSSLVVADGGIGTNGGNCTGSAVDSTFLEIENFDGGAAATETGGATDITNSGSGGDNVYGQGGEGVSGMVAGASAVLNGRSGTGYGAGGSGSIDESATAGSGTNGLVRITW